MDSVSTRRIGLPGTEKIRAKARDSYGANPERARECPEGIVEKVPEEFGITGRLWTLGRTREYIQKEFHKTISERTLSDYMKRWGMSCQRPVKRARRQNPQGI